MLKPNVSMLGFDDRLLTFLGIPILTFIIPILFFNLGLSYYMSIAHQEYFEDLAYTTSFWISTRYLMIQSRRRFGKFEDYLKRLGWLAISVMLAAPIISLVVTITIRSIYKLLGTHDLYEPNMIKSFGSTYFITFAVGSLYEAIYFFHKYKEAILEKEQIQRAHIQGQLDNLRNQINPHFLFNSLNTLMNLIPTDSDRAMNYLSKLSKFYRYTVSTSEDSLVYLDTEMNNVKIYTGLLKERFHTGIIFVLPEGVPSRAQILPLCLQLLIENAVKHNIVSNKNPLQISIRVSDDERYIFVANNIQKKIQELKSTGMGLKNIKSRIAFFTEDPLRIHESEEQFEVAVPLIYPNN